MAGLHGPAHFLLGSRKVTVWKRLLIALMATVGAMIATGLVLVLIVVEATGGSASYDTMGEAHSAGAVSRGWVPSFLPMAAYEIAESHDMDTNERCSRASLPAGHAAEIEARLVAGGFYRLERWWLLRIPSITWLRSCPFDQPKQAAGAQLWRRSVPNSAEAEYVFIPEDARSVLFWGGTD